ncbi:MAG: hypothetical protein H6760_02955 [Candidatus Nomurabacteria bacterium]|nr:MAG: hypothetical protein H6760_02955 [Candidatus Nomurabacteria bacterium]
MKKKYLVLDSSQSEYIIASLYDGQKIIYKDSFLLSREKSASALKLVEALLKKAKVEPKTLSGIFVTEGVGRFSLMRACMSVALSLGYVHKIPIATVDGVDPETLHSGLARLAKKQALTPRYSGEPNIILPKKR